ncbi:MAG TPA: polyphosphate polymerase domain-containing protein [Candidatus Limnocylindria bacterium]|nr:polyphosphate polymerase domain-containing protein [Candidatus Limnocylindria bacterium]
MNRLQEQRYELKYWVDAKVAPLVREFVLQYLQLDPFGVGKPENSYPVHSIYLDSERLDTYWHTINGNKNRYKLRIRYYDDQPNTPAFFEIKRRANDVILKDRGGVKKSSVPRLLEGHHVEPEDLLNPASTSDLLAVQHFQELMFGLDARPMLHVGYDREAFEHDLDSSARVTMDRNVITGPVRSPDLVVKTRDPHCFFGTTVILELKFTSRFPLWFQELVQRFDCVRTGAAKYTSGIEVRGEDWGRGRREPPLAFD